MVHTPGPWKVKTEGSEDNCIMRTIIGQRSRGGNEVAIVTTGSYDDETECANAGLIAAAPELLKALREMVAAKKTSGYLIHFDGWEGPFSHAEAAIAKAEGR